MFSFVFKKNQTFKKIHSSSSGVDYNLLLIIKCQANNEKILPSTFRKQGGFIKKFYSVFEKLAVCSKNHPLLEGWIRYDFSLFFKKSIKKSIFPQTVLIIKFFFSVFKKSIEFSKKSTLPQAGWIIYNYLKLFKIITKLSKRSTPLLVGWIINNFSTFFKISTKFWKKSTPPQAR